MQERKNTKMSGHCALQTGLPDGNKKLSPNSLKKNSPNFLKFCIFAKTLIFSLEISRLKLFHLLP